MKSLRTVFLSATVAATGMNLFQLVDLHYHGWTFFEEETVPLKLPTNYMQSHFVDLPTTKPSSLNHQSPSSRNNSSSSSSSSTNSTPIFWHVPKSGGTTMKQLGSCLGLAVALQWGREELSNQTASLNILKREFAFYSASYVNIDATSVKGMQRAHQLGFAEKQPAEVIFTPWVRAAAEYLFDDDHRGTVFALLRHPVSRAISLYYYLQIANWEKDYDPTLHQNMTLEAFANVKAHNNPMTRDLMGKDENERITPLDMKQVKAFLSTKVLVGLSERMSVSVQRFGHYLGWNTNENEKWKNCSSNAIHHGSNTNPHPRVEKQSAAWKALTEANKYDMELYKHAVELFRMQQGFYPKDNDAYDWKPNVVFPEG
jgi:hypothetical protein